MSRFGIAGFYLCVVLILLRGYLPIDFCGTLIGEVKSGELEIVPHLTKSYYSTWLLPTIYDFFQNTLFSVGKATVTLNKIFLTIWVVGAIIFLWKWFSGYFFCKKELMKMPKVKAAKTVAVFHKAFQDVFPGKENRCIIVHSDLIGSAAVFGTPHWNSLSLSRRP